MSRIKLLLFVLVITNAIYAQDLQLSQKDSIVKSSWMVGLGYNFVDDSGSRSFEGLFDVEDNWNALAYPSRVSIGRYFESGLGIEAIGAYNKYKVGKIIDGAVNTIETDYFSVDARLSYDLNKIIGETAWFDPYVGAGVGYTEANNVDMGTYNAVIGFRTWFSDRWGLDLSSSGKFAMDKAKGNHLQHSAGVVYRFGAKKDLSKRGLEKLALIEAFEKENQRKADSIAAKKAEEEARLLAERLALEKEKARLAAEEKAKRDAEEAKRKQFEETIKGYGDIQFGFNSSYLNSKSRAALRKVASLMETNPNLSIQVNAHTDSRGESTYNQKLSQSRAKKTVAYLVRQGVSAERITSEAHGEQHLLNDCDDNIRCSEAQHRVNRRSDFKVIKF
ncbi:Outer membrane protein OmpA [Arenibacter nanhaiticus]|uniref:Outer membrane protein OmpA n=1 Tax=Arenibacter nanhaiticus TaxID=558155 RepID=A0A1M6GUL2_9FLAO|nr:OmpA family protein [Arenibacter nanhaiticus]SHJ13604.1 Outer membrane protein OmpA [Arenibacter nanhaiticus]